MKRMIQWLSVMLATVLLVACGLEPATFGDADAVAVWNADSTESYGAKLVSINLMEDCELTVLRDDTVWGDTPYESLYYDGRLGDGHSWSHAEFVGDPAPLELQGVYGAVYEVVLTDTRCGWAYEIIPVVDVPDPDTDTDTDADTDTDSDVDTDPTPWYCEIDFEEIADAGFDSEATGTQYFEFDDGTEVITHWNLFASLNCYGISSPTGEYMLCIEGRDQAGNPGDATVSFRWPGQVTGMSASTCDHELDATVRSYGFYWPYTLPGVGTGNGVSENHCTGEFTTVHALYATDTATIEFPFYGDPGNRESVVAVSVKALSEDCIQ